ncbi:MAG TPA: hypothetical protein VF828_04335 [Patescibacteria group bacterium]
MNDLEIAQEIFKSQNLSSTFGIFEYNVFHQSKSYKISIFCTIGGFILALNPLWNINALTGGMVTTGDLFLLAIMPVIFGIALMAFGIVNWKSTKKAASGYRLSGAKFLNNKIQEFETYTPLENIKATPVIKEIREWNEPGLCAVITLRQSSMFNEMFYFSSIEIKNNQNKIRGFVNHISLAEATTNVGDNRIYCSNNGRVVPLGYWNTDDKLISCLDSLLGTLFNSTLISHEKCKIKFEAHSGGSLRAAFLGGFIGSLAYSGIVALRQNRLENKLAGHSFWDDFLKLAEKHKIGIDNTDEKEKVVQQQHLDSVSKVSTTNCVECGAIVNTDIRECVKCGAPILT